MGTLVQVLASGSFVVCSRPVARELGLNAAALLGEMCARQEQCGEGFEVPRERLMDSTTLGRRQFDTALGKLVERGIVSVSRVGMPARNAYTVSEDRIADMLAGVPTCGYETYQQEGTKRTNKKVQNVPSNICSNNVLVNNGGISNEIPSATGTANAPTVPTGRSKSRPENVGEVEAYIAEKGFTGFTARQWWDHYEANGWKVGRNAMKDWRAAVRTWANMRTKGERDAGLAAGLAAEFEELARG